MDFRRLQHFLTVVETGSIARAAQQLHVAQPALSVQMRQLESMAGCQLLSRSSRGVVPTPTGLEFCRRAKETLRLVEGLRGIGQEPASSPAGHVVIGTVASTSNMIAVPLVNAVRARYPAITLELLEPPGAYITEMLLRGRIDIAVLVGEYHSSGIQVMPVLEEDLFVAGLEGACGELDLQHLHGVRLVMPPRANSLRTLFDRACAERGVTPQVVTEVSSPYTMVQLVRAGLGATVLPLSMLREAQPQDMPVARLVNPVLTRPIALATAVDVPQSPQLLAVKGELLEILEGSAASGHGKRVWRSSREAAGLQRSPPIPPEQAHHGRIRRKQP